MNLAQVYLSLGSNIGDREVNLHAAIAALPDAGVRMQRVSSIYETQPVDYVQQPWFLNCVVEGETQLKPLALLRALQQIELHLGRKKAIPKGPRAIDLDILLYGDESIATPELQIPHPRMAERRFALAPLAELVPRLRHPAWSGTVADLLARTSDTSQVRKKAALATPPVDHREKGT
jgi:2-amino-4-hydroxy-6-hydroxymethyldihydropteridine diphosphokinase